MSKSTWRWPVPKLAKFSVMAYPSCTTFESVSAVAVIFFPESEIGLGENVKPILLQCCTCVISDGLCCCKKPYMKFRSSVIDNVLRNAQSIDE